MLKYHPLWLVALMFWGASDAGAALPETQPSRMVEVKKISAPAEQLLFQLAYAAQPLCQKEDADWTWSLGGFPRSIPPLPNDKLPKRSLAEYEELARHYNMGPGASIFLADIDRTPWGYAGFKAREPFEFAEQGQLLRFFGTPKPDSVGPHVREKNPDAAPLVEFSVKRNGEPAKIAVRRVAVCQLSLNVVDGTYRYADSEGASVIVTVPLLARLSRDELVVVLAHEVAHVALKLSRDRTKSRMLAQLLVGSLASIGENQESELREPKSADLVRADRLAMRLSSGFGVDVPAYAAIIRKLVQDEDSFGAPTYRRTRGIDLNREEKLQRSVDTWNKSRTFYPAHAEDRLLEQEVTRRAKQVYSDPASVFSASAAGQKQPAPQTEPVAETAASEVTGASPVARVHAGPVPPSTSFADLANADALPRVSPRGRTLYLEWLTEPFPRAVALSDKGAIARAYGTDAMERAVRNCEKFKNPCRLYAVDDKVVWTQP